MRVATGFTEINALKLCDVGEKGKGMWIVRLPFDISNVTQRKEFFSIFMYRMPSALWFVTKHWINVSKYAFYINIIKLTIMCVDTRYIKDIITIDF